jgi:hypothetical protein
MKCILCNKPVKLNNLLCTVHKKTHLVDNKLSLGVGKWIRKKQQKGVKWKTQRKYFNWAKRLDKSSKEEVFPPWTLSLKGVRLEFDIVLPSHRVLIEVQGPGHYRFTKGWHKKKKDLTDQLQRDRHKLRQAINAGWHVVWIPTEDFMSQQDFDEFIVGITDEKPRHWEWPVDRQQILGDKPTFKKIRPR